VVAIVGMRNLARFGHPCAGKAQIQAVEVEIQARSVHGPKV
jgi:hypothetical protein